MRTYFTCYWNSYTTAGMYYAYYGRADLTPLNFSSLSTVTNAELTADRVLMTDWLFEWGSGGWGYNHGLYQSSFIISSLCGSAMGFVDSGAPQLSGLNEAYGDGHVAWKPRSDFNLSAMLSSPTTVPSVHGGGADYSFY
jgi:hypothetical protein